MQESVSFLQARENERHRALELDALAARAAKGERAAFETIYNVLVDDLYSYVRGQCRNETVAEDIVSSVFLKAWRSATSYRPGSNTFQSWVFTIARNELRDHWRTSQRTLPMLEFDITDDVYPDGASIDPQEARVLVERALEKLTDDQRQVVVLRYFGNKSHEEIASIMGKREGAVRALLMRALRQMRKVVGDAAP